jgi:hypothetical protein
MLFHRLHEISGTDPGPEGDSRWHKFIDMLVRDLHTHKDDPEMVNRLAHGLNEHRFHIFDAFKVAPEWLEADKAEKPEPELDEEGNPIEPVKEVDPETGEVKEPEVGHVSRDDLASQYGREPPTEVEPPNSEEPAPVVEEAAGDGTLPVVAANTEGAANEPEVPQHEAAEMEPMKPNEASGVVEDGTLVAKPPEPEPALETKEEPEPEQVPQTAPSSEPITEQPPKMEPKPEDKKPE